MAWSVVILTTLNFFILIMKINNPSLISFMKEKASHSPSSYRISAIAFDHKGDILGHATNSRSSWNSLESYNESIKNGTNRACTGSHAERRLMARYGNLIKTIIICRIGRSGDLLPISACKACTKVANKLGIKIISVSE